MRLAEVFTGWPLAISVAAVLTVNGLLASRRRAALNLALHELRRPLQALALAGGPGRPAASGFESSLRLAAVALERLDREVNGGGARGGREAAPIRPVLESAVARWRSRASLGGGSLELRWRAGHAVVEGDHAGLSQAFDNMIVNAIEHGGPTVVVEAGIRGQWIRVSVADPGHAARPSSRRGTPAEVLAALLGRKRHGHGLAVIRQTARAHGGRFALHRSERGALAVLELPLAPEASPRIA